MTLKVNKKKQYREMINAINTVLKARKIQKDRVDANVMGEQLTHEELEKFHKPVLDLLQEIPTMIPKANEASKSLISIDAEPSSTQITLTPPGEVLEIESLKTPKRVLKSYEESLKSPKRVFRNVEESSKSP